MRITSFHFYGLIAAICLLASCANIVPPSGGKIDSTPPKLLSIKPQDSLLNTRVTQIDMHFDEFVVLGDVAKELQISPRLKQKPTMSIKGKTVTVKIADSLLQENTTYTLNFGQSIKDLHEGNTYQGPNYVFSTGAWFDSLQLKGTIVDAASGKIDSSGKVQILLYDAQDSNTIVLSNQPMYSTTSNTKGRFVISGLPQKSFRVFALKENNASLKFDSDDEFIGFKEQSYLAGTDTSDINFVIFKEIPDSSKQANTASNNTNKKQKVKLGKPQTAEKTPALTLDSKKFEYQVLVDTSNNKKRTQDITHALEIYFSRPIDTFDLTKIALSAEINAVEQVQKTDISLDSSRKKISIQPTWQDNVLYTLRVLKSFATDTAHNTTMPSKYIFRSKSEEDYGSISVKLPQQYIGKNYYLQLLQEGKTINSKAIQNSKIVFSKLDPGSYTLQIFEDSNGDEIWTTGELKENRQAEKVIAYPFGALNLKAGWEHVVDFETSKEKIKQ